MSRRVRNVKGNGSLKLDRFGRKRRKGGRLRRFFALAFLAVLLGGGWLWLEGHFRGVRRLFAAWRLPKPASQTSSPADQRVSSSRQTAKNVVQLALIIDDLGRDLGELERVARFPQPVAVAVLPGQRHSREVAERAAAYGMEVLCHLPMEPEGGEDPGPGALKVGLPPDELERRTLRFLREVPGARGVNNHMGSRFTRDRVGMRVVLHVLRRNGLFFVDSWTSAESVGPKLAQELGVPYRVRDVFLDDNRDPRGIAFQFQRWLELGHRRGTALAIGHPHRTTLELLEQELPKALRHGYELVPVSKILTASRQNPGDARYDEP